MLGLIYLNIKILKKWDWNIFSYINPFKILLFEGLFGVILSIIASIGKEPFKYILIHKFFYTTGQLILLICLLFFYLILSITTNAYKVYSNIIFSPMDASLINYMLNPAFNIYFLYINSILITITILSSFLK